MATTQTVTIVFTDLVSSTEQWMRLDPAAAEELRQTHFGLLRAAISAAGGHEVKNLGDGLMVAFTSLTRALAGAVEMQQAIERYNRRGVEPLSVRIGISTGEATEDNGDYFGDPVIEASRLCAAADGGQILATAMVQAMAGRHATQEFAAVGDLELKGLPEPVPGVEVVWEPAQMAQGAGDGRLPLPAPLVGESAESLFAFFGRATELTRLTEALKASSAERVLRVVLISGEPGIGKTSLVAQAARSVYAGGANVLYGDCEESLGIPYQPWIVALTQLVEHLEEERLAEFVEANGSALARLVPALSRRLTLAPPSATDDADAERFLIVEGAVRLLAAASVDQPLVVVLDDLHWVDAASLQLLRHLVASAAPMAVMVVGNFRESDLSRSHPLTSALADLRRARGVERIHLTGLADTEIIDLLVAAAGHEMADEGVALAHALSQETGGNPFFLVEVVRHLAETGAFVQDENGRWVLTSDLDGLSLPTSVREVVSHRVVRLGDETEQALSLAAVIGREFDVDLLAGLLGADVDRLLDLLEGAIGAGLVGEAEHVVGRYRFVHALIQHTLYQELGATRRQRAHQRVAEALEAAGPDRVEHVSELARHWMAATRPSDTGKAVHYARRAGDAALASYAPLDAAAWFTQALELLERQTGDVEHERCSVQTALGTAQLQAGQPEYRETLRAAGNLARALGDSDLMVDVALIREPGIDLMAGVDPDRWAVLNDALHSVGQADSAARARILACMADEADPREVSLRTELAVEALDVARRVGDDPTLLFVSNLVMAPMTNPDTRERRLRESAVALELSERVGDVSARFAALGNRQQVLVETGNMAEVDLCVEERAEIARQTGLPNLRYSSMLLSGWRMLFAGQLDAAEARAHETFELGTALGNPVAVPCYGAQLFAVNLQRGALSDELARSFEQERAQFPTMPGYRSALGLIYCELGRFDEAVALLEFDLATGFSELPFDITWLQSMQAYGEVAATLGHRVAAAALYQRILPYEDHFVFLGSNDRGLVGRTLGRLATALGRYEDAERHLVRALEDHQRLQAPYWVARNRIDLVELMVARGSAEAAEAGALLVEARQAVDRYGFGGLLPRIEKLAAAP